MLQWLGESIATIVICLVLIGVVAAIIAGMIKKKRAGKSMVCNCGCCKGCPMSGSCHDK